MVESLRGLFGNDLSVSEMFRPTNVRLSDGLGRAELGLW